MSLIGIGVPIVAIVFAIIIMFSIWISNYKKVGPEEAGIVFGRSGKRKVITNGGGFVLPFLEQIQYIPLTVISSEIKVANAITESGVPLVVSGVAMFKVDNSVEAILKAAERFLGQNFERVESEVKQILEGSMRAVLATMTPEVIYQDRQKLQEQVVSHIQPELAKLGMKLDVLTIRDIEDNNGYLKALGREQIAIKLKEAEIAEANAKRDEEIQKANARKEQEVIKAQREAEIAEANRDREKRIADADAAIKIQQAIAQQAGPKQEAISTQEVIREQTVLAERRAELTEKELVATRIKPADADKLVAVINAEANKSVAIINADAGKQTAIIEADGDKQARITSAEGTMESTKKIAEGRAFETTTTGEAEANIIKAKLVSEGEGIEKKAVAMQQYNEAGFRLEAYRLIVDKLPEIVEKTQSGLSNVQEIKIVDLGGNTANGTSGPIDKLMKVSPASISVLDETLKALTGKSLNDLIEGVGDAIAGRNAKTMGEGESK